MDNILDDLHLEGKQKYYVLGGLAFVILAALYVRHKMNASATSSDSNSTMTASSPVPNYTSDPSGYGDGTGGIPGYGGSGTGTTTDPGSGGTPSGNPGTGAGGTSQPVQTTTGGSPAGSGSSTKAGSTSSAPPSWTPVATAPSTPVSTIPSYNNSQPAASNHPITGSQYGAYQGTGAAADVMAGLNVYSENFGNTKVNTVTDSKGNVTNVYTHPAGGQFVPGQTANQFGIYQGSGAAADVAAGDSVYTTYVGSTKINTVIDSSGKVVATYNHPADSAAAHLNGASHPAVGPSHVTPVQAPAHQVTASKPVTKSAPAPARQPVGRRPVAI